MPQQNLTKLAAAAIRQLQNENQELKEQLTHNEEAVKLAFDLHHQGIIAAEQVETKIKEFIVKTASELDVIKKASEFTKTAAAMNSFKLSSIKSFDNSTAEDRFMSFLLEDNI